MKKFLLLPVTAIMVSGYAQTNYALNLNGTDNYVTIGTPLSSNTSYTKEAWVYATTSSGARNIISSLNTPFWINGGILSAGQAGSYSLVTDATSLPLNTWVYVAVSYDAATTTMKLYRDGLLVSTNSAVSSYDSENTFIGSHQGSSSFFQGYVDEVRIWSTVLTQAQLKQNMYKGPAANASGLVAYYKCNDGSGSTLTNATGGTNGTLQNTPSWISSPVQSGGNALSFDGTNDVVTIADDNSLHITTAITLEAWCYATKNSGIQNVICKSSNVMNTGYIFPRTDDGWSHVVLYLHIGAWKTLSAAYPSLNAWHHLAATYDGSTMKLYIDGALAASQAQTGAISSNTNSLALGNQPGFSEFFGGSADEFRIWNVARTQTQIQNNMNKELDPAAQTGLVSYYTSDQGIAGGTNTGLSTLVDQKGNNNGALSNFALAGATSNFVTQNSGLFLLPLNWLSFTVQKQGDKALLKWSTTNEHNTTSFIIQHKSENNAWENIGTVMSADNSAQSNYSYLHNDPESGMNYYRLLEKDSDGKESYSDIKSLKFDLEKPSFIVLSNPVSNDRLQIKLNTSSHLWLYNVSGELIWHEYENSGTISIDASCYARGTYFLKANKQTEKIILR